METIIGLIVFGLIFGIPAFMRNYTFDHRLPPNGYRVDHGAMSRDLAMGKSKNEVMDKCNRGGYDVKK